MKKKYCETCSMRDTCTSICERVEKMLSKVTNKRSVVSGIPTDFKEQLYSNPRVWPSPPDINQKNINRKVLYLHKEKGLCGEEIGIKLNISTYSVYKILKSHHKLLKDKQQ